MQQKIKPLGNRILVKREEAKTTKGGIILPETAQKKPQQGKVLRVGDDNKDVKVGDEILFSAYAGTEYKEHLILSEDDVLAVLGG